MKSKNIIILISLCFGILSCEQDKTESFYCVNTIRNSPATVILSESELVTIKSLIDYNRLDFNKYQFFRLQNDELGYHHVRCNQFVNGLRVFTDDIIFHFDQNDKYYSLSGDIIEKIDLNTKISMDYDSVVEKFLYLIEQDNTYIGDKKEIINNCFDLEFGYFDLNAGISYSDENFTKAWKIKPTNRDYPYAYINDENSETISYDNGIRY
ncbi:MAG: fungalysin/thermolysin family protein [Bacteroidetes bacterium]|nr:fungalysin/thermolysin family protein [Bacteroidota bacterium]